MGQKEAILFDEKNADFVRDVKAALDQQGNATMIEARKKYFERWQGQIDGYEDYRLALCILAAVGEDDRTLGTQFMDQLDQIKRIYMSFPAFRGRSLVEPTSEACKAIIRGTGKWYKYLNTAAPTAAATTGAPIAAAVPTTAAPTAATTAVPTAPPTAAPTAAAPTVVPTAAPTAGAIGGATDQVNGAIAGTKGAVGGAIAGATDKTNGVSAPLPQNPNQNN